VRDGLPDKRIGVRHIGAILGCDLKQVNEPEGRRGETAKRDHPPASIAAFSSPVAAAMGVVS
jgi:hypothetical protein